MGFRVTPSLILAADISIADAGNIITATDVEGALQENRTAIDAAEAAIAANTAAISAIAADYLTSGDIGVSVQAFDAALNALSALSDAAYLDEDNLGSNSATHLATQQSIKAYVDNAIAGVGGADWTYAANTALSGATTTVASSIPADVSEIEIWSYGGFIFTGGLNQTIGVQLGDSGGIETTGYASVCGYTDSTGANATSTSQLLIENELDIGDDCGFFMRLVRENTGDSAAWVAFGTGYSEGTSGRAKAFWGRKALSASLTQIRMITNLSFNSGQVRVRYR